MDSTPPARYVGRFAPSPTGPLHFGSLLAALASWLDARAANGRWLLRIEDLDAPRTRPGAADTILRQLERFGLDWDGEVLWQSRRTPVYVDALRRLDAAGLTYPCGCTRREIADSSLGLAADGGQIYPGTCRNGLPAGKAARAIRVRVPQPPVGFVDRIQGAIEQALASQVGDFVLRRADGLFAYQLAVVVDDAEQGITDVVRGADLLDSTPRQCWLRRCLGLHEPRHAHVPVALDATGGKLSKQTGAYPVDAADPGPALAAALGVLGHPPPAGLAPRELLAWGIAHWDLMRVPAVRALRAPVYA